MSQEHVEITRGAIAAYNRRDLDALLAVYAPDVELVTLLLGKSRGRDAIRRALIENQENMPGYGYEIEELIDAGDTVIAAVHLAGSGRVSQIALGDVIAISVTFRDGLVVRQQTFRNKAEAREAAGLSE